jgi:predicted transcriptional regulator
MKESNFTVIYNDLMFSIIKLKNSTEKSLSLYLVHKFSFEGYLNLTQKFKVSKIANDIDVSLSSVKVALKSLKNKGMFEVKSTGRGLEITLKSKYKFDSRSVKTDTSRSIESDTSEVLNLTHQKCKNLPIRSIESNTSNKVESKAITIIPESLNNSSKEPLLNNSINKEINIDNLSIKYSEQHGIHFQWIANALIKNKDIQDKIIFVLDNFELLKSGGIDNYNLGILVNFLKEPKSKLDLIGKLTLAKEKTEYQENEKQKESIEKITREKKAKYFDYLYLFPEHGQSGSYENLAFMFLNYLSNDFTQLRHKHDITKILNCGSIDKFKNAINDLKKDIEKPLTDIQVKAINKTLEYISSIEAKAGV